MMKYIFLLAAWMIPGLALAEGAIPQIVKNFVNSKGSKLSGDRFPGGVKGWVGQYQDMGVTLFLTPDGKHVHPGIFTMIKGKTSARGILKKDLYPLGREMWKKLNDARPLKEGADSAARKVIVFADPFCPYCKTFWSAAQPWVKAGKVQLNTLLVAFLNPKAADTPRQS
jgi:thiol:disulfide interchange protein DsbG